MEEKALAKALIKLRPEAAAARGQLVSIVITNRDGEDHLRRLLEGLERRTNYRSIELILVDNGSSDGSLQVFDRWPGTKRVIANQQNQSFSVANNQGIRAAAGELVLLANNDIEPIHPDWLGYMVASMRDDVTAVGAMLVYPRRPHRDVPPAHPDLTIQHLGISFEYSKWGVRAVNTASGDDPLLVTSPGTREVPAVTAACLLARRADLLANPLDERYWYGSEDWDLCLRLGNVGKVLVDERAVLFHHEFGTQDRFMSDAWLEGRAQNHRWFNELWGPSIMRRIRSEVTGPPSGRFFRGERAPALGLIHGSDARTRELAETLRRQAMDAGWTLVDGESKSSDLALALTPPRDVQWFGGLDLSIALVLDREGEWVRSGGLDAATRVIVPDLIGRARLDAMWGAGVAEIDGALADADATSLARMASLAAPSDQAMRIGVSTCAPDWTKAQFWGDTHLARGLMRAFRRLGHEASELIMSDWQSAKAASCDLILHLRGLTRRPVSRGQWNALWIISHPDRLEPGECDDYDVIASASHTHAEFLSKELGRTVHFMPQATDADTFKIGPPSSEYETEVLYVGNARWPNRRAPRWMMRNGRAFDLYGKNWGGFPEAELVRSDYVPNQDLAAAYRSASVVVADHHGSMRSEGFIANRLFDVLASGGLVLSDDVRGLSALFDGVIPTYSNPNELESQLRILLADDALRRQLSTEGRHRVSAAHTLDHRATTWLQLLQQV